MTDAWAALLNMTPGQALAMVGIVLIAGIIRGFTGFALSAFGMAIGVLILPPVQLIPVLWWLEVAASLMMLKGGWADADKRTALILGLGSMAGMVAGLGLTTTLDPNLSRHIALALIITLAALQLARVRLGAFASPQGTALAGVFAGIATGLAGVGGMIVALYVLAQDRPPRVMRATLVLFLLLGSAGSLGVHLAYGTMNVTSTTRGLALILPCLVGVWLGARLFTPSYERWYKTVCLTLLIGLAVLSLLRSLAT